MKRIAIIVGNEGKMRNFLPGVSKDMANFKKLLLSNAGGAWEENEIICSKYWSKASLEKEISRQKDLGVEYFLIIYSRELFLKSGFPAAILASIIGVGGYYANNRNPWLYGILFGILGAFVSIWTRYGKVQFTGQAHNLLHILECYSRILIGTIFAVVAMVAIQCQLILPQISDREKLYSFIIAAFIASFSERFIPSIVERITKENNDDKA